MKSGRVIMVLLIGAVFVYLIFAMARFGEGHTSRQASGIEMIIGKALVQCYALEGSYPRDIERVQDYGVIFDNDRYVYYYEWYGSNLKPTVIVIER